MICNTSSECGANGSNGNVAGLGGRLRYREKQEAPMTTRDFRYNWN